MSKMIFGTGSCVLEDAVSVARCAAQYGCEGVLCLPPFYYKEPDAEGVYAFYSELIQRVADNNLKIFLYHFPQMSAVAISASLIERLLATYPSTVIGLKDSSGDWANTSMLIDSFPGFSVFSGSEQFLLQNLNAGGTGCISASTNITAPLAAKVCTAWRDELFDSIQLQRDLSELRLALQAFPMVPLLKTIMARQSHERNWLNLRPPLVALSTEAAEKLETLLPRLERTIPELVCG